MWWYRPFHDQPVQWDRWSAQARCSGSQGKRPRLGSARCQRCTAQYEPSGALQAATTWARVGPSYGRQAFSNSSFLPKVPQPPARSSRNWTCFRTVVGWSALSAPQARTSQRRARARYVSIALPSRETLSLTLVAFRSISCDTEAEPASASELMTTIDSATRRRKRALLLRSAVTTIHRRGSAEVDPIWGSRWRDSRGPAQRRFAE